MRRPFYIVVILLLAIIGMTQVMAQEASSAILEKVEDCVATIRITTVADDLPVYYRPYENDQMGDEVEYTEVVDGATQTIQMNPANNYRVELFSVGAGYQIVSHINYFNCESTGSNGNGSGTGGTDGSGTGGTDGSVTPTPRLIPSKPFNPGDDRLNRQAWAPVAVYCEDSSSQVRIYAINPDNGRGSLVLNVDYSDFDQAASGANALIASQGGIQLYLTMDGDWVVVAPQADGKQYQFAFDGCA